MKKFVEWYRVCGREVFESVLGFLSAVLLIFFIALIAGCIRNLPLFFEYVAKTLVEMGNIQ